MLPSHPQRDTTSFVNLCPLLRFTMTRFSIKKALTHEVDIRMRSSAFEREIPMLYPCTSSSLIKQRSVFVNMYSKFLPVCLLDYKVIKVFEDIWQWSQHHYFVCCLRCVTNSVTCRIKWIWPQLQYKGIDTGLLTICQPPVMREKCIFPNPFVSHSWRLTGASRKMTVKVLVTKVYTLVSNLLENTFSEKTCIPKWFAKNLCVCILLRS